MHGIYIKITLNDEEKKININKKYIVDSIYLLNIIQNHKFAVGDPARSI